MTVGDAVARVNKIDESIRELEAARDNAEKEEGKYGRMQFNSLNPRAICEIIGFLKEYKALLCGASIDI